MQSYTVHVLPITTVVLSIMYRSDVGIPTTNPTAIAPRKPAYHMAAVLPKEIFRSLDRQQFKMGINVKTEMARPTKINTNVNPVKDQEMSLTTPTVAMMPVMMKIIMSAKLARVLVKINARVCPSPLMLFWTKLAAIMPCNKLAMMPEK